MKNIIKGLICPLGALLMVSGAQAAFVELITNGDFETGDVSGWSVFDQNNAGVNGSFYVDNDGSAPFFSIPTVGPAGGSTYYAVSDSTGPGAHALSQTFTLSPGALSVELSFDMFVNDYWSGGPSDGTAGLDPSLATANQHARVDILSSSASPLDTGAGVLQNFYLGNDGVTTFGNPNPYIHYVFDITALVGGGGTFDLRFAEVNNQNYFNLGVDNVSIQVASVNTAIPSTPIPAAVWLFGSALGLLGLIRRRQPV